MQLITKLNIGLFIGTLFVFGGAGAMLAHGDPSTPTVLRAHANILGAPGSGISGTVQFTQGSADDNFPEPGVWVAAKVEGLTDGAHGLHIHEVGTCEPFTAAGGHFDPGPNGNSNPDANHPFHLGDLPNLVAKNGVGRLNAETSRITLSPGPLSVFDADGSAIVVHLNPDQGITGAPGSGVSGGARIACGVIELDN
jgi:Cu-Zn family superoxide dismutase